MKRTNLDINNMNEKSKRTDHQFSDVFGTSEYARPASAAFKSPA